MANLKILHLAGWYPSEKNPVSGSFVKEHVEATSKFNDVIVVYSEGLDDSIDGFYRISDRVEEGIRTIRLRYRKLFLPKTALFVKAYIINAVYRRLIKEGWKPDILHAHVYNAGFMAALLKKRYLVPLVVTEHYTAFTQGKIRGLNKVMALFTFKSADVICPVSEGLKKYIMPYSRNNKYHVVPNVVNGSLFSLKKRNRVKGDIKLLQVAMLVPKKGITHLLEAIRYLKAERNDFTLDIIGEGTSRNEYDAYAKELGIDNHVCFRGLKTKKEVADYMRNADLLIVPSLSETFSVVAAEALYTGTPVLVTRCGGPEGFVNEEVGLVVEPGDSIALFNGMKRMLDNINHYSAERLSRYAKNLFSPEVVGSRLDQVYSEIIEKQKFR